jgi:hypothetical protein
MSDIVEVYGGRGRLTLNGLDPSFRGFIAALNERSGDPNARESIVADSFAGSASIPEFRVVATGLGSDEDGLFVAIALVFDDESSASEASKALEDRIANGAFPDLTSEPYGLESWGRKIERAVVEVSGRTVTARIRVTEPSNVQQNFILRGNGGFADDGVGVGTLTLFLIGHD